MCYPGMMGVCGLWWVQGASSAQDASSGVKALQQHHLLDSTGNAEVPFQTLGPTSVDVSWVFMDNSCIQLLCLLYSIFKL